MLETAPLLLLLLASELRRFMRTLQIAALLQLWLAPSESA
jgi:hypothetical protein